MFCPNCGKEMNEGAEFCNHCGYKIVNKNSEKILKEKKSGKLLVILLIIVCIVISFIIAKKFFHNNNKNKGRIRNFNNVKLVTEYSDDTMIDDMDTVKFGKYLQNDYENDEQNRKVWQYEPIEWIVLDRDTKNKKVLLLSKYVLDNQQYNDKYYDYENSLAMNTIAKWPDRTTWEKCSLRQWLNEDFFNNAFSDEEKDCIILSDLVNSDNIVEKTLGGNNTQDNVFILSYDETSKYFYGNAERSTCKKAATKGTNWAKECGLDTFYWSASYESDLKQGKAHFEQVAPEWASGNCMYYLRTPDRYVHHEGTTQTEHDILQINKESNTAMKIHYSGGISVPYYATAKYGIRPAMWVSYDNKLIKEKKELRERNEAEQKDIIQKENDALNETFKIVNNDKDISEQINVAKTINTYDLDVSIDEVDTVTFGSYKQLAGNSKKQPIEWVVLEKQNGKALLLSKYALEYKSVRSKNDELNWEKSNIRDFLNDQFIKKAFNDEEKKKIIECSNENIIYNKHSEGGKLTDEVIENQNNTMDKVFLLSASEMVKYNNSKWRVKLFETKLTPAMWEQERGLDGRYFESGTFNDYNSVGWYPFGMAPCEYWTRSIYGIENCYIVNDSGAVDLKRIKGFQNTDVQESYLKRGIRPAIWVQYDGEITNEIKLQLAEEITQNNDINVLDKFNNIKTLSEYSNDISIDNVDNIKFGQYAKSDVSGSNKEPIEWVAVEKDDANKKVLLMTKYIIDYQLFSDSDDIEWKDTRIRKWLNEDFINKAFSDDERIKILDTKLNNNYKYSWSKLNSDSDTYEVHKAEDTIDKVFLLSTDDIIKYFYNNNYNIDIADSSCENKILSTKPTSYASNIKDNNYGTISISTNKKKWNYGNSGWALRSMSKLINSEYESGILGLDEVMSSGRVGTSRALNHYYGIRPAMWVSYQ